VSNFLHSVNNKYLEFLRDYYLTFSNNDWYNDDINNSMNVIKRQINERLT
jgi:hypothetical protein